MTEYFFTNRGEKSLTDFSLALYIHIPYCLEKCPYCDFHSVATQGKGIPSDLYLQALSRQLFLEVGRLDLSRRPLVSVFFGGGTPSLMPPSFFNEILEKIFEIFEWRRDIEITIEMNPATANREKLKEVRLAGVNRVSIGVQSFQESLLKKLGRNHSVEEAREAIRATREAGFENFNCDLIFGIEGETLSDLKKDLESVLNLEPPHVSAYQLTVEPGTPLAHQVRSGLFHLPEEEILGAMHGIVPETLSARGLPRYEISNYARRGFESRHNLQYWNYGDYLGLGSGAVSFIGSKRWRTTRKLKSYLAGQWDYEDEELIDKRTALKEKWMMGLRLSQGLPLFNYGLEGNEKNSFLVKWKAKKAISLKENRLSLTPVGFLWYNQIVMDIFEEIDKKGALWR